MSDMTTIDRAQIEALKPLASSVQIATECGEEFFYLTDVTLPDGCSPQKTDILLCPHPRDGYTSRMYFAHKIDCPHMSAQPNWNGHMYVLDRSWHAFSWRLQPQERIINLFAEHIRGLRA
jgi:hypothetical protein